MTDPAPVLTRKPVSQIITFWRPGSYEWSWADEYGDLMGGDNMQAVKAQVSDTGIHFADHREPIILGNDGRVWDGHHRICIAIQYGIPHLMVNESEEL